MSYGITPVAVSLAQVAHTFGSRDAPLLAQLSVEFQDRILDDAANRDDDDDDEGEEPASTLAVALREIIDGTPLRPAFGHKYGYALELLCLHFGDVLPNSEFSGIRSAWADTLDAALASLNIPETTLRMVRHIMYRGSPLPIPAPDDFPSIGYLKLSEIPPANLDLQVADLTPLDPEVRAALLQLGGWLQTCSDAGLDLVCFYY